MAEMQPFLISEFKTGLFNYLEPWIRPQDAFEPLENAFVYRGSIQKRQGYTFFGRMAYQDTIGNGDGATTSFSGTIPTHPIFPTTFTITSGAITFTDPTGSGTLSGGAGYSGTINYTTGAWTLSFAVAPASGSPILANYNPNITSGRPIMGLKLYTNETTDGFILVAMDTRRASVFQTSTETFLPISSISQIIWTGDITAGGNLANVTTQWAAVSPYTNSLAPFSVTLTAGGENVTDNGSGVFGSSATVFSSGTVNYSTGAISITFKAKAVTVTVVMTATLVGDYFSGNSSNFFNSVNWLGQLYLTNNVDPITLYNGSSLPGTLSRPSYGITVANVASFTNNIGTALDVNVYKNSLLIIRPTIINNGSGNGVEPQNIRWSAVQNPTNTAADFPGNGGQAIAPTDDFIQSSNFLRDQLIVFFSQSAWTFRYTGNDFNPFVWNRISSSKACSAPYGTIGYDERVTAMGSKGLIACDGANVQRYDLNIIDEFTNIDQNYFGQCYAMRYDSLNQSYMTFVSDGSTTGLSDSILVYNFLENTWSTYKLPMSCLGLFYEWEDTVWDDFMVGGDRNPPYVDWNSAQFSWNAFFSQTLEPIVLGGGLDGIVYQLNESETDNGASIPANITTSRLNPFTKIGQKVQFGWIDFYYSIIPSGPQPSPAVLTLSFMSDNSSNVALTRTLTLDGPVSSDVNWKRIYINNIGEFLRMNITSTANANFRILGMILWAKPSGRFTP